jgi:hypothetical protein
MGSRMQISVGICLYLLRMGGSLPHMHCKKAWEVVKCLLKEIIPYFGIPVSTGSDNGPAFVAVVVQLMAKGHQRSCTQSSGKVEQMNRTLKSQLGAGDPAPNYCSGRPICNGINYYPLH